MKSQPQETFIKKSVLAHVYRTVGLESLSDELSCRWTLKREGELSVGFRFLQFDRKDLEHLSFSFLFFLGDAQMQELLRYKLLDVQKTKISVDRI